MAELGRMQGLVVLATALGLHLVVERWLQPLTERLLTRAFSVRARPASSSPPPAPDAVVAPAASPRGW